MQSGRQFLQFILNNDEENALKVFLCSDVDLFIESTHDYAIHLATRNNMPRLVKKLLLYGANPYALNNKNESALTLANNIKSNDIMLAIYRSPHEVTIDIGNYILDATVENDVSGLKCFFKKADRDVISKAMQAWRQGKERNSALHLACYYDHMEMIDLLTEYGADHQCQNALGQIPIDLSSIIFDWDRNATPRSNERHDKYKHLAQTQISKKYIEFITYLSRNQIRTDEMHVLGAWDEKNKEHYFKPSENSI